MKIFTVTLENEISGGVEISVLWWQIAILWDNGGVGNKRPWVEIYLKIPNFCRIFYVISQYNSVKRLFLLIVEYYNYDYTMNCMKYSKFCSIFGYSNRENLPNLLTGGLEISVFWWKFIAKKVNVPPAYSILQSSICQSHCKF